MNSTDYFLYNILPICIVVFGVVGNMICFAVFSRQKFKRISLNLMLRVMAITDIIALMQILPTYFKYSRFNYDVRTVSTLYCKFFVYLKYFICPVKGWILVIIALERYMSVQNPRKSLIFKKKHFQYSMLTIIFLFNMSYNLPYAINLDLVSFFSIEPFHLYNSSAINQTSSVPPEPINFYQCRFVSALTARVVFVMHFVNTATMPFSLMLLSTILVIISLYNSKTRMSRYSFTKSKKNRRRSTLNYRDIRFSFTSIMLNVLFLAFNVPLAVFYFTFHFTSIWDDREADPFRTREFALVTAIYFANFATPLLVYLVSNSIFSREFVTMVKEIVLQQKPYSLSSIISKNSMRRFEEV